MPSKLIPTLKNKIVKAQLLTAVVVLFIGSALYITNDIFLLQKAIQSRVDGVAKVLSANLVTSVAFNDAQDANRLLESLRSNEDIFGATVTLLATTTFTSPSNLPINLPTTASNSLPENIQFANYGDISLQRMPSDQQAELSLTSALLAKDIKLSYPIIQDGNKIAHLNLFIHLSWMTNELYHYLGIVSLITLSSIILAFIFASQFQQQISQPVKQLLQLANKISFNKNYGLRFNFENNESPKIKELNQLAHEFNQMLEQIQNRDNQINLANSDLEKIVKEKTRHLVDAQHILVHQGKMSALGEMALRGRP